jgi:hypothetical protein
MGRKIIKSSVVTREQYDKLQVDVVNRVEELEQTIERLAQANNNRHIEIRVVGTVAVIGFAVGLAGVLTLALA